MNPKNPYWKNTISPRKSHQRAINQAKTISRIKTKVLTFLAFGVLLYVFLMHLEVIS